MSEDVSQVQVRWSGGQVFLGTDVMGHTVVFDSSTSEIPVGIGPMTSLLASLGACSGMDVVAILRKRKQKLASLKISVRGERPSSGYPRPFTEIEVKYTVGGRALESEYVQEAVRDSMEKFCSVAATISGKAKIRHSYEIVEE